MIRLAIGLFLILLPFLELILLVKTSQAIGFWTTLLIMIVAAAGGGLVLTQQSATAFRQALEAASRGQTPHGPVLDGVFLMLAGVLLVVPGLITDAMGLLLLLPPVRHWVARQSFSGISWGMGPFGEEAARDADPGPRPSEQFRPRPGTPRDGPVIEGEFERLDERNPGSKRPGSDKTP